MWNRFFLLKISEQGKNVQVEYTKTCLKKVEYNKNNIHNKKELIDNL